MNSHTVRKRKRSNEHQPNPCAIRCGDRLACCSAFGGPVPQESLADAAKRVRAEKEQSAPQFRGRFRRKAYSARHRQTEPSPAARIGGAL